MLFINIVAGLLCTGFIKAVLYFEAGSNFETVNHVNMATGIWTIRIRILYIPTKIPLWTFYN